MDIRPALPNPFAPKVKKYQHNTIKYCAWEVLRDFPRGLSVGDIIREIMGKDLRKFYSKRKPESIVSGELTKQREHFKYDQKERLWSIKINESVVSEGTQGGGRVIEDPREKQASTIVVDLRPETEEAETQSLLQSQSVKGPITRKRSSEGSQSLSPRRKFKMVSFVGHPARVWWRGENRYFPGQIVEYNEETNKYKIEYEDGDVDNNMEFLEYDIIMDGDQIGHIKVDSNNLDASDYEEEEEE